MTDRIQESLNEIDRQRRLVDQSTTAHSIIRDRYRRRSTFMNCSLLSSSVLATAFAFASGDASIEVFGFSALRSTVLGWFAVVTFATTLIDMVLDWRGATQRHDDAVRQLASLKMEYRTVPMPGEEEQERDRLSQRYQVVMDGIASVPDGEFNALKSKHLRKIEISKILSANPGMTLRQARRELNRRFTT
ncbi:hypothetical protein ACIO53_35455 [Streptomyces sp. NPDC087305]|uniref:hypothetical protein n=1 Tax=Streptomyces sp. NPDC087305 TaxID=3365781 RepID=UPI00382135C8